MVVGICYDLRSWYLDRGFSPEETAEFDREDTIFAIEETLNGLGYATERAGNIFQLVEALAAGKRWDLVFNISEGLVGPARESVVPALLDQYRIPCVFSNAEVLGICLNKQLARQVAASHGIPVAPGQVVRHPGETGMVNLSYPLFVKPLYEGTGKGIDATSRVASGEELVEAVERIINRHHQPALVEEFLPGREFTAGITGTGEDAVMIGAMEIVSQENGVYSYRVKEHYRELARYLPVSPDILEDCSRIAIGAWKALGGADGGRIDLRYDRHGTLCFIEANPLAGLHPVHSDLPMLAERNGITYRQLLQQIMNSALRRHHLRP